MVIIRDGLKDDCTDIEAMIKELRTYERQSGESKINRQVLEKEVFGEHKLLRIIVAEDEDSRQLIGYALYFFKYSTYKGKSLYLEDLYVRSTCRQSGTGRALLTQVTKEAAQTSCSSVEWSCWDWNYNSIKFYKKFGAEEPPESEGWLSFKLERQQIENIVNENQRK